MDLENWKEIPLLIYVILLAVIGGMVSSIEEQRKDGKTVPIMTRLFIVLMNGVTSGFAGVLMYWLYSAISNSTDPSPLMWFSVGVSGWLGGGSIKFFVAIWKAFLHAQTRGGK